MNLLNTCVPCILDEKTSKLYILLWEVIKLSCWISRTKTKCTIYHRSCSCNEYKTILMFHFMDKSEISQNNVMNISRPVRAWPCSCCNSVKLIREVINHSDFRWTRTNNWTHWSWGYRICWMQFIMNLLLLLLLQAKKHNGSVCFWTIQQAEYCQYWYKLM